MLKLLLSLALFAPAARAQYPLDTLRDSHRILLIFAPQADDARLTQQFALLAKHAADLRERDLVIIPVLTQAAAPPPPDTLRTLAPAYNSPAQQAAIRAHFRIAPADFTVILVGKDGGEKLRTSSPITIEKLSQTIDAMPMRQDEMGGRHQ